MKMHSLNNNKNQFPEGTSLRETIDFWDVIDHKIKMAEEGDWGAGWIRSPVSINVEKLQSFMCSEGFEKNPYELHSLTLDEKNFNGNNSVDLLSCALLVQDLKAIDLILDGYQKYEQIKEEEFKNGDFVVKYNLTKHPLATLMRLRKEFEAQAFQDLFVTFVNLNFENLWGFHAYEEKSTWVVEALKNAHGDTVTDFIVHNASEEQCSLLFGNLESSCADLALQYKCSPSEIKLKVYQRLFEEATLSCNQKSFFKIFESFLKHVENAETACLEDDKKSLILNVCLHAAIHKEKASVEERRQFIEKLMALNLKKGDELEPLYGRFPNESVDFVKDAQLNIILQKNVKPIVEKVANKKTFSPGRF